MKRTIVSVFVAVLVCLLFPCMVVADISVEDAKPIKGGDTKDGALVLTEVKYGQIWQDEARYYNIKKWYKLQAIKDGTFMVWVKTLEEDMLIRVKNEKGNDLASEIISGEYIFTIPVKKDEVIYLFAVADQTWYEGGQFLFSVCFDGFHAPSAESEIAHYATCSAEGEIIYPCTLCGQPGKVEPFPSSRIPLATGRRKGTPAARQLV